MYGVWVDGGADKHIDNNERAFWKKKQIFLFFFAFEIISLSLGTCNTI